MNNNTLGSPTPRTQIANHGQASCPIKAAIYNLPNEPNLKSQRMSEGGSEKAYLAAKESVVCKRGHEN